MNYIVSGSKEYKRAKIAFLIAGLVTFALIYTTQPTMPLLAKEFNISAPTASLSLSLTTGLLAVALLAAAPLSDRIDMKTIMVMSMILTSILGLLTSLSSSYYTLLLFRAFLGITVAGVPSIAMAFIGREFSPKDSMMIMGFYISGSSIGGMTGRLLTGLLTDLFSSWRIAFAIVAVISLILSIVFWICLPNPKNSVKQSVDWSSVWTSYKMHLLDKNMNYLFIVGFLLMGSFVTMYNYIGFLLMKAPYNLSQTIIGFIFIVYLSGTFSSIYMGKKAKQFGSIKILKISILITIFGGILTLVPTLFFKILGVAIFTFGFFAGHSIASSLVSQRAKINKAQASSLYLLFYYLGSSVIGAFGGFFWEHFSWFGIITFIFGLLAAGLILTKVASSHKTKAFIPVNTEPKKSHFGHTRHA